MKSAKSAGLSMYRDYSTYKVGRVLNDEEIKTVGHLADRNRDRFSDNKKAELDIKHKRFKRRGEYN